jgi:hypothetical protein
VNKAIASTEMKARLFAIGADPADSNSVDKANVFLRTEIEKYRKTVQAIGLKED